MATSHLVMQGKGGVGKSLVASILIQYLLIRGLKAFGCDTDPVNSSLARYKSLDVKVIDIMDGDDIDPGRFDELINLIDSSPDEAHMVVDIGASCFVSLCSYLKKYSAFKVLQEQGHTIYIHSIITGGVNLLETLNNLDSLFRHFDVPIIVWLNPFFGEIKIGNDRFEDFKIYREMGDSLRGIIEMPDLSGSLFERDFMDMQARYLTFEEGWRGATFFIMERQRLLMIWRRYQQAIDLISLV